MRYYIKMCLRKKHTVRWFWVRDIFRSCEEKGEFQHFLQELRLHDREITNKKLCLIS